MVQQANLSSLQQRNGGAVTRSTPNDFPGFLKAYASEIKRALPAHMNADRMTRIALTEFRKQPKLGNCDPKSVFAAVIMGAQLGLEPGIMGQAYLIPYGRECQFVPGWQGLADLVSRAGRASIWTGAVFEGDDFDYALGDRPFITHRPQGEEDPSLLKYVYAVGRINGSEWPVLEVWTANRIRKHRDRFNKVGNRHYSFQHFEMYARKVVLLQVLKYMPKSIELATAVNLEHSAESGRQNLAVNEVLDGTWAPVPEEQDGGHGDGNQEQGTEQQAERQEERKQQRRQPKEQTTSYSEPRGEEASDEIRRAEAHEELIPSHHEAGSDFNDGQFNF